MEQNNYKYGGPDSFNNLVAYAGPDNVNIQPSIIHQPKLNTQRNPSAYLGLEIIELYENILIKAMKKLTPDIDVENRGLLVNLYLFEQWLDKDNE